MTDAELTGLRRRADVCVTHHHGCDCREYRLRALDTVARAVVGQLYAIDPLGRYCCVCEWYAERGHKDDCPVGRLAALVGEEQS